jgi:hypothetical protein
MGLIYAGAVILVGVIAVDAVVIQRTLAERAKASPAPALVGSAQARSAPVRADIAAGLAPPSPQEEGESPEPDPGFEEPPGETVVDPPTNKPKNPGKGGGQTVEQAFSRGCSTSSVEGLSRQIVAEARCMNANAFAKVPARKNLVTPGHVFLHLEAPARDQLVQVLDAHPNLTMTVNSAFRTVAQQYLLDRWARTHRCGIKLAAKPGESNHETGLALDVSEHGTWRTALESQGFRWLGPTDRVHFDYQGSGAGHHEGLDILAFQRLWNRNHPEERIAETSHYDEATESHLRKAPAGGFPVGPQCSGASHPADRPTSRTTRKH